MTPDPKYRDLCAQLAEREATLDRVRTIIDEACGLQVGTDEEILTVLEAHLFAQRRERDDLRAQLAAADEELRRHGDALAKVVGERDALKHAHALALLEERMATHAMAEERDAARRDAGEARAMLENAISVEAAAALRERLGSPARQPGEEVAELERRAGMDNAAWHQRAAELEAQLAGADEELVRSQAALAKVVGERDAARESLAAVEEARDHWKQEARDARAEAAYQLRQYEGALADFHAVEAPLANEIASLRARLTEAEGREAKARVAADVFREMVDNAEKERDAARSELEAQIVRDTHVRDRLAQVSDRLQDLTDDRAALSALAEATKRDWQEAWDRAEAARALLRRWLSDWRDPGDDGTVAALSEATREWLGEETTGDRPDERNGADPTRADAVTPANTTTTPARGPVEAGTSRARPPAPSAGEGRPLPRKVDTLLSGLFPRRSVLSLNTPMELAVRAAMDAIEAGPADVRLTNAGNAVADALAWVADYYEDVPVSEHFPRTPPAEEGAHGD